METTSAQPDNRNRYNRLLFLNLIAILCNLAIILCVVPVFGAMFADFGARLPAPTQFCLDVSNFLTAHYWMGALLVVGALLGAYRALRDREDPSGVLCRTMRILLIAFGLFVTTAIVIAMFLPIQKGVGVVP